jgi:ribosome-associated toxin RatA of RatAB toxin-antitoxin module
MRTKARGDEDALERSALVPYSARQMFDLVRDVESYPEWFAWCRTSEVEEVSAGEQLATLEVELLGMRQRFATRNRLKDGESITLSLAQGPLSSLEGAWQFKNLKRDGVAIGCKVALSLRFEFKVGVVDTLIRIGFNALADRLVDDFVAVAKRQYG